MKKVVLGLAAVVIVGLAVWRHQVITRGPATDKPIVKIGIVAPLSGNLAIIGRPVKGALEVAFQDANARGGKYFYQPIFEDNQFSPMRTATILKKFVFVDKVDAILSLGSNIGLVTAPVAEENKVPHISLATDPAIASGTYNFINWTTPETEARKAMEIILKKGYKRIALIVANHQGPLAMSEALVSKLNAAGIVNKTLVSNPGIRDFRIDIEKLKRSVNPDLYVMLFFDPELTIFIKQLRESGAKTDVTGIETFSMVSSDILSALEGTWCIDGAEADNETMDRIKAHNKSDATYALGQSYDSAMLLVKAFETAPDKAGAIDILAATTEYDGIVGRLTRKGNIFDSEAVVKTIRGGKAVIGE
ncbi:MAG: ABC transporter substrate-binding protein [Alphaproteobacteria bacterium]|nr:ABC transporter substrate-binding protein [Alphaproteobacteria bacterium]